MRVFHYFVTQNKLRKMPFVSVLTTCNVKTHEENAIHENIINFITQNSPGIFHLCAHINYS